jgi:hypothetical protein
MNESQRAMAAAKIANFDLYHGHDFLSGLQPHLNRANIPSPMPIQIRAPILKCERRTPAGPTDHRTVLSHL